MRSGSAALCSVSGDRGCCAGRSLLPGRLPLLRWAKWVYIERPYRWLCLFLRFSPIVNNVSYFTRYVVLFYPAVYALWLYACRGKGWRGLLAAVTGGIL